MEPNGGKRAGTWESATSRALMLSPFRSNDARVVSSMHARAVERSFRECAELDERSLVWIAAANSTAENLISAPSFDWYPTRSLRSDKACHPEPGRRRGTSQLFT